MQCPSCHTDNPSANRFCDQCGETLEAHCPQCSTVLRAGARFCGACGHRLAPFAASAETSPSASPLAAPAAPSFARPIASYTPKHLADKVLKARSAIEGERRQVTVLFADIAGFTGLAEGRDPEEVHQIVDRCFEAITAEVHRFEGTINQYTGDGVMALFGAPIAHEDGARRAVHAALGIQRAMRDLSREIEAHQGPAIRMRIGLNTGPVVVGRIGDDLRMDYTAVGDTTNVAARLQQAARPGSVLVSESTLRAIGGFFETLDLGQQAVKGHAPVRAHEVLRPRRRRSRLDAAIERGLTPLVGRARELDILRERFREVLTGRGQVVFVAGEAGIGKSRLLLEFRRGLAETGEDATWLEGQCVSFGQAIPFLPIVDQLRRNFGIEEFDGEPEIIAKIEHGMRQIGDVEAHIPYIRYLLAVDPGDSTVAALDAQARRRKVFDALRALTVGGAARRPLVLVVEDLHWIDVSSEEYLASLIDSVAGAPLMLILTYRVGYTPPFGTRSFHTALTLTTLPEREALAVAASVLGTEDFPRELKEALLATAEGVPLFIEEMTKTLVDLGVLRRENGGYRIVKRVSEVNVPDTIQGIIMARLDRLGEDGKRTVQLASVIGRQFLRRLLDRVSDMGERLDGLLQELKAVEIIYEQGLAPEPTYAFKHAVIQDVAYQSLLRERRRDLHRGVGYAIEDLYADRLPEHFEELAHHFVHGEEWGKAFQYLVWSGDKARLSYANQAGLDFYAKALDLAPRVSPPVPARETARVHESRANLLELTGQHEGARDAYDAAMDLVPEEDVISRSRLCREIGKTWEVQRRFEEALRLYELAEATLGEKPLEPETEWWREWIQNQLERMRTYYWIGNVSDIVMLAEKTRPRIEHDGSSSQRGTFFSLLTLMALRRDRYIASTETVSYAEAAVAASLESDDQTELVWTRFVLGFALLWHGELQRAEQELRDVLSLAERVGDVTTRARILTYLTIVRRKCVDVKGVREYATRSLAASAPGQMIEYVGMAKANLAWAAQREGNLDEALELGRNAYELLQPLPQGAMFNWVYRWPLLSLALARDQLSEAIDHARALLSPTTQPPPEAVAAALNAAVHIEEAGKPEDVRRCLLRASEMARQDGYL